MKSAQTVRRIAVALLAFAALLVVACNGGTRIEPLVPDAVPRRLSADVLGASGLSLEPIAVRSDALGARVAAWLSTSIAGRSLDVVTADAPGGAWTPVRTLAHDVLAFELVTDGVSFALVWVEDHAGPGRLREVVLRVAHRTNATWTDPLELGRWPQAVTHLRVAARGGTFAVALGFHAPGAAVRAFTGDANGWSAETAFDALEVLAAPGRFVESADAVLRADGQRFAVAWRVRGPRARCGASVHAASAWSVAVDPFGSATVAGNGDEGPDLASDGSGFAVRCSAAVAIWRGGAWGAPQVFAESAVGALCGGARYAVVWQAAGASGIRFAEEDGARWSREVEIVATPDISVLHLARTSSALVAVWQESASGALLSVHAAPLGWVTPFRLDDGVRREQVLEQLVVRAEDLMATWRQRVDGSPDTLWGREWLAGAWLPRVAVTSAFAQDAGPEGFAFAAMRRLPRTQAVASIVHGGVQGPEEVLPAPPQVHVAVPRSRAPRVVVGADGDADGEADALWIEDGLAAGTPRIIARARGRGGWDEAMALTPVVPSGTIDLDLARDGTRLDVAYATGDELVLLQRGVSWTEWTLARGPASAVRVAAHGGVTLVAWRHEAGVRATLVRGSELLADRELGEGVTDFAVAAGTGGHGVAFLRDGAVWLAAAGAGGIGEVLLDDAGTDLVGVDFASFGSRSTVAWSSATAIKVRAIEGGAPFAVEIVAHERADAAPVVALGEAGCLITWTVAGAPRAVLRSASGMTAIDLEAPGVPAEHLSAVATRAGFVVAWVVRGALRQRVRMVRHTAGDWQRAVDVASGPPEEPILALDLAAAGSWVALVWERGGGIWGLLTE